MLDPYPYAGGAGKRFWLFSYPALSHHFLLWRKLAPSSWRSWSPTGTGFPRTAVNSALPLLYRGAHRPEAAPATPTVGCQLVSASLSQPALPENHHSIWGSAQLAATAALQNRWGVLPHAVCRLGALAVRHTHLNKLGVPLAFILGTRLPTPAEPAQSRRQWTDVAGWCVASPASSTSPA
jgi:hypothetical protein